MKILLIDVNCKSGSTGKIVYDLYTRSNAKGDETAICYGRGKKIREKNIFKFGLDLETIFHAFLTRITGYTGCFSYFSTRRLIKFIKKFRPDVVHMHELHAYFVNIPKLLNFLKKQDIRIVQTLHCAFAYTGKCGHHLECENWKNQCGNCPRLRRYVSTLFFDHTRRMFLAKKKAYTGFNDMTIVCPSEWLAGNAKMSFLKQYPVKVIRNGIDTSVFYPRDTSALRKRLGIKANEKIVLAVAPDLMKKEKGGEWVLKLSNIMKDSKVKFVMVGVDNVDFDCPNNVLVIKRTNNQDELATLYSLADVFVICSEMENFPTTCLEAQCCGTPICGFDVGGTMETTVSKQKRFVRYGDLDALHKLVTTILDSEIDKKYLAQAAIQMKQWPKITITSILLVAIKTEGNGLYYSLKYKTIKFRCVSARTIGKTAQKKYESSFNKRKL